MTLFREEGFQKGVPAAKDKARRENPRGDIPSPGKEGISKG